MNTNKKNITLLILSVSCLFLMVFQISLVKGATHTELTLNDEKTSQRLGTSDTEKLYYIDAPEGRITIRVFDIMVISGLEVTLQVASDENYGTILGTGTNAGQEEVSVNVIYSSCSGYWWISNSSNGNWN